MSLAQENFDRARNSGQASIEKLATRGPIDIRRMDTRSLRTLAWDLEAIEAALRIELNNRLAGPDSMDMG